MQKLHEEIREKETLLEKLESRVNEAGAKAQDLKVSFENLCGTIFVLHYYVDSLWLFIPHAPIYIM